MFAVGRIHIGHFFRLFLIQKSEKNLRRTKIRLFWTPLIYIVLERTIFHSAHAIAANIFQLSDVCVYECPILVDAPTKEPNASHSISFFMLRMQ